MRTRKPSKPKSSGEQAMPLAPSGSTPTQATATPPRLKKSRPIGMPAGVSVSPNALWLGKDPDGGAPAGDALATVVLYHQQPSTTSAMRVHSAPWTRRDQPDPFRRFQDVRSSPLPCLQPDGHQPPPPYEDLYRQGAIASVASTQPPLLALLECSFGDLSHGSRPATPGWALRANPSSGNLHPTEAYVLIDQVKGVFIVAGSLSLRGQGACAGTARRVAGWTLAGRSCGPFLKTSFLGLTSVELARDMEVREQVHFAIASMDVGHALGSARIAAQTLGWAHAAVG